TKLKRLRVVDHVDVRVEIDDLTRRRIRQRAIGIAFGIAGVALMIPSAIATARCNGGMDGGGCDLDAADMLTVGAASLAVGGLLLALSFGPRERVRLRMFPRR